jgi:hypothetical protein
MGGKGSGKNPKSRANLKPPAKGEVRNPKGINRKRPWTDRMFAQSEELLIKTQAGRAILKKLKLPESATWADASVWKLILKAAAGEISAIKEMADRIEGKAPERLEISGPERKQVTIRLIHDRTKV